jgi:hypothetical protein
MGEVWFAPDDPSLPTPWKRIVHSTTGHFYYWNPETNITNYEKPVYWVSSPSLSPSCFPDAFYPPPFTTSGYTFHSQYPNLNSNHQVLGPSLWSPKPTSYTHKNKPNSNNSITTNSYPFDTIVVEAPNVRMISLVAELVGCL